MAFGDFDRFPHSGQRTTAEITDLENFLVTSAPMNSAIKMDLQRQIAILEENIANLRQIELSFLVKILPNLSRDEVIKYTSDNIMSVNPRQAFEAPPHDKLMKKDNVISDQLNYIKKSRPYVFSELQKISNAIKRGWDKIDRLNKLVSEKMSSNSETPAGGAGV